MAEQQEEMSVNEILSSIKDILVENETSSASAKMETAPVPADDVISLGTQDVSSNGLSLENGDDDILNLSQDMRINSDNETPFGIDVSAEDKPLDIDAELAGVSMSPEIIDDKGDEDDVLELKDDSDPVAEIISPQNDEPEIDVDSEPYYNEPQNSEVILPDFVTAEEIQPATVAIAESELIAEETMPEPETEPVVAPIPVAQQNETQFPKTEAETLVEEDKAVDVSANIISNFAKMFAQNKDHAEPEAVPIPAAPSVSKNIKIGNPDATLEDMVKSAIAGMVSGWVSGAESKVDIKEIADREIARQTKIWLDANLPSIVETIVKKEIERVMVKVGRN